MVAAACCVPSIIGGINFVKYLQNDSQETRKKLPEACIAQIITNVLLGVWLLISSTALPYYENNFGYVISRGISVGIFAFIFYYFYGVCKRYEQQ